jgi:uncharacterized membrane protein
MEESKQRKLGKILALVLKVIFWVGLFVATCFIPGVTSGLVAIIFGCIGYIAGYVSKRHKDNRELTEKLFKDGKVSLEGSTISITTTQEDDGPAVALSINPLKEAEAKEEAPTEKPVKKNKKKKRAEQPA